MRIIAITGGIATGKSSASKYISRLGHKTIDCDIISKQVLVQNEPLISIILGENIKKDDKICIDKLRRLLFTNKEARLKIESIIHPYCYFYVFLYIIKYLICNERVLFVEVPLFYEIGADRFCDSLLIYCDGQIQKTRLNNRDGPVLAAEKLKSQMPIESKIVKSTYCINNNDGKRELEKKIRRIMFCGDSIIDYGLIFVLIFYLSF